MRSKQEIEKELAELETQLAAAKAENAGGKIQINGTFGKTGSVWSILFAPEMMIQTTITGQLSLLMLIEWMHLSGIGVISANTDGIVLRYREEQQAQAHAMIAAWEQRCGLKMEHTLYRRIHSRDVNCYFAVKPDGEVKRKGMGVAPAGLAEGINPDCEICADAVAEFLAKGVPLAQTIATCTDIRKFVTIATVNGGGKKLWGNVARRDARVVDMMPTLEANGWEKSGRGWSKGGHTLPAAMAYKSCFEPPVEEYLGKVVRWYYGINSPGPIVYVSNNNTVSLSYGAMPCMMLPDTFPNDVDYSWYIARAEKLLEEIGFYSLTT